MLLPLLVAIAALSGPIAAQYDTLPTGYGSRPGTYAPGTTFPFAHDTQLRYQEIHTSWTGRTAVPPLTAVGFRRSSFRPPTPNAVAHSADLALTVGLGDFATFTNNHAANFSGGSTTVFANRPVSMPDWTQVPPAPWPASLWLTLDQPYVYAGRQDLVWEIVVRTSLPNLPVAGYYADRAGNLQSGGNLFATGCTASGRTVPASLSLGLGNRGPGWPMTISTFGDNLPALAPVTLVLGFSDPDLAVPGLCARLRALPDLMLPAGTATASGLLTTRTYSFPYSPAMLRVPVYAQGLAPDAGQPGLPILVTDARVSGMPPDANSLKYVYSHPTTGPVQGPYSSGSVITLWR